MLVPKRTKYRRPHRLSYEGRAKGGTEVTFGDFGLQALTGAWITNRQIEAARIAMTRYMKRNGRVWIKIFPHLAKTAKPLEVRMGSGKGAPDAWVAVVKEGKIMFEVAGEVRMGSGKGAPDAWVAVVKEGKIMFEVAGVSEEIAREALRLAAHKLPVRTKFVKRENGGDQNES